MANLSYTSLVLLSYKLSYVTYKSLMKTVDGKGTRPLAVHFTGSAFCQLQGYFLYSPSDSSFLLCQINCKFDSMIRLYDMFGHNSVISQLPFIFRACLLKHTTEVFEEWGGRGGRRLIFFANVFFINLPLLSFALVSVWKN